MGFIFERKSGTHAICMLDMDGFKKQLDQIKVMMNKTTLAAANTHERFSTSSTALVQPLPDSQWEGKTPGWSERELLAPPPQARRSSPLTIVSGTEGNLRKEGMIQQQVDIWRRK